MASNQDAFSSKWKSMSAEQKRQSRLNDFVNGIDINFINPQCKAAYQMRAKRLADVYSIQEPDRVPFNVPLGDVAYILNGVNMRTAMYDHHQAATSCKKFNEKYSEVIETYAFPYINPGRIMELLDYKLYSWPGFGLPQDSPGIQFIEGEYMRDDEYDDLITDPSDFWLRTYLPRVFGTFAPFTQLRPFTDIIEIISVAQFSTFGTPEFQDILFKMAEIGREYKKIEQINASYSLNGPAAGFPVMFGGVFAKAPFDTLGDTLRGTANIMKDMYRRPEQVLAACDKIADFTIRSILKSAGIEKKLMIVYPLHKGADGWMSQKQFEKFYWPSLKKVMDAFINEGLIQSMFAEGSFNTRLESVNDFPKGTVTWMFDQTDIFRAKEILGSRCCIQGNIPSSMMVTGSASEVKALCKKLIENCGKGGGYILGAGAIAENPKLENLQAMGAAAREFGVYTK
jgi:hypothetical protein